MLPVLSREQCRQFDERAAAQCCVPSLLLMENAGRGACDALLGRFGALRRVLVVCGGGNNAGDGFVVARRLLTLGHQVSVVSLVPRAQLQGDAASQAAAYLGVGGEIIADLTTDAADLQARLQGPRAPELVVDAVFGTGLSRPLEGRFLAAVQQMNASGAPIVALDLPSGLDADSGQTLGAAVRATLCVTFGHYKPGLLTANGAAHAPEIEVVDIGVPPLAARPPVAVTPDSGAEASAAHAASELPAGLLFGRADARALYNLLPAAQHKGQAGRVLVIAGSSAAGGAAARGSVVGGVGTLGAARLTARGAHRAGAGLITVASFPEVSARLEASSWESMTLALDPAAPWQSLQPALTQTQVLAIGPGLGSQPNTQQLVLDVARRCVLPVVLDADALLPFCGQLELLRASAGPRILTPHPKEAARLLGCELEAVQADRFAAVRRLSELSGAVVLLKGAHTLVHTRGEPTWVNGSGNSALAVGGAGDVLTGMIAALACQLSALQACGLGAWLHGRAAERWSARMGTQRGMLARQIATELPRVFGELQGA